MGEGSFTPEEYKQIPVPGGTEKRGVESPEQKKSRLIAELKDCASQGVVFSVPLEEIRKRISLEIKREEAIKKIESGQNDAIHNLNKSGAEKDLESLKSTVNIKIMAFTGYAENYKSLDARVSDLINIGEQQGEDSVKAKEDVVREIFGILNPEYASEKDNIVREEEEIKSLEKKDG